MSGDGVGRFPVSAQRVESADVRPSRDVPKQRDESKQLPQVYVLGELGGLPTMRARIDGVEHECLLDTGANVSLIHQSLLSRKDWKRMDAYEGSGVQMANGTKLRPIGTVEVLLRVGTWKGTVVLTVLENFRYQVLIGMDIAKTRLRARFDLDEEWIQPKGKSKVQLRFREGRVVNVNLLEDIVIPSRSAKLVKARIDAPMDGKWGVMEPRRDLAVTIGRALVDEDENGFITIPLLNTTSRDRRYKRNCYLGRLEAAEECNLLQTEEDTAPAGDEKDEWQDTETGVGQVEQMDLRTGCDLDEEGLKRLKEFLLRHSDTFATQLRRPGLTNLPPHRIITTEDRPVRKRAYRTSRWEADVIKHEIDEMLANSVVEPSQAAWAAPVVLVRKPDGKVRFCVDYRGLNEVTTKDVYPLPLIDETLDRLGGAKFFSSLDACCGYWQIAMHEEDMDKTTFITQFGLHRFRVMPYGLVNAGATFQRAMDVMLTGLEWKCCLAYVDDIIIFSSTLDNHLRDLELVFTRLAEVGLKLKAPKCSFCQSEFKYLGFVVSKEGVKTDPAKIEAVEKFPTPKTRKQVRGWLGLTGWYRRFVKNYATIAAPLTLLLRKKEKWVWGEAQVSAFEELRNRLMSAPILAYPDFKEKFNLETDASGVGLGAILSQGESKSDEERVIAYASRSLHGAEYDYTITEQECLAMVWAIKKFRPYLYGRRFTAITDHGALRWLFTLKDPTTRCKRWVLKLQEYTWDIRHRAGVLMPHVDALSRCHEDRVKGDRKSAGQPQLREPEAEGNEATPLEMIHWDEGAGETVRVEAGSNLKKEAGASGLINLKASNSFPPSRPVASPLISPAPEKLSYGKKPEYQVDPGETVLALELNAAEEGGVEVDYDVLAANQREDRDLAHYFGYLENETIPRDERKARRLVLECEMLFIHEGRLWHQWWPSAEKVRGDVVQQLVVPARFRTRVLMACHDDALSGHMGFQRTYGQLRRRFWWKGMYADARRWIRTCTLCQEKKTPKRHLVGKMQGVQHTIGRPWEMVGMDVMGPLPKTYQGNTVLLVITDYFTRWPVAFALPHQRMPLIAKCFVEGILCEHGAPEKILTDQGPNFMSGFAEEVYEALRAKKIKTSAYHPQTDGMVERFNHTFCDMVSMFVKENQRDWDEYIPFLLFAFRTMTHATTKESPFYMLFGRDARSPLDRVMRTHEPSERLDPRTYKEELHGRLMRCYSIAKENAVAAMERNKARYDQGRREEEPFRVGDLVLWKREYLPQGRVHKLARMWDSTYRIEGRVGELLYRLRGARGKVLKELVHVEKLRLRRERVDPPDLAQVDDDGIPLEEALLPEVEGDEGPVEEDDEPLVHVDLDEDEGRALHTEARVESEESTDDEAEGQPEDEGVSERSEDSPVLVRPRAREVEDRRAAVRMFAEMVRPRPLPGTPVPPTPPESTQQASGSAEEESDDGGYTMSARAKRMSARQGRPRRRYVPRRHGSKPKR